MLDHVGFSVTDFDRSRQFYKVALAPLGLGVQMEVTAEMTGPGRMRDSERRRDRSSGSERGRA